MEPCQLLIEQMLAEAALLPQVCPEMDPPSGSKYLGEMPLKLRQLHALWELRCLNLDMVTTMFDTAKEEGSTASLDELQIKINLLRVEKEYAESVYRVESARYFGTLGTNDALYLCKEWQVHSRPGLSYARLGMIAGLALFGWISRR